MKDEGVGRASSFILHPSSFIVRVAFAAASGILFALSFPDYALGFLAFIALIPLLVALARASSGWEAFFLGWISQTIAWLIMVPWVVRVMSHYGGLPYFLGVLIFVAMSLVLGLYGAVFGVVVYRIRPGASLGRWLIVPLAWASIEYARTYLLTGFPWNLLAAALVDFSSLIQFDRVAGPYLIGAMMLVPSVLIAWMIVARPRRAAALFAVGGVIVLMFVWWATGLVASKLIVRPSGTPPITAALLQPNISQEMRWDSANLAEIYQQMMTMTADAIDRGATIVIWPESTVPLSFGSTDFYRNAIESISRARGADIILGSVAEDARQTNKLWNAAFLVSDGRTIGHYDKIRLVPFGEYVPLRKMLFFANKLVRAVGEFEFGTNDRPLRGKLSYGPAICYEVVFPQIAATQVRNGADVLVTITNDAWYDGTSAPRQHLNQARLRAIEDDRYLLRAGTTGISAAVDPAGTILEEIPMGRRGTIFAKFQPRRTMTPYVRFGDWFAWVAIAIVLFAIFKR
ncbi:MAG TPA: apolipoprotein N-acyltransferase [Thermoanaerobaculia bacterium]|jgi:apolipoprotein N-acyltransferase|nr:apolipoprotein N-acyltransferase [Thermoanaerobaculia bacterium]